MEHSEDTNGERIRFSEYFIENFKTCSVTYLYCNIIYNHITMPEDTPHVQFIRMQSAEI